MNPITRQLLALAIATPVATLAWAIPAPTATPFDTSSAVIRNICPRIDAELQDALARLAMQHEDLRVRVQMRVDGQRISGVELQGLPGEHRLQIRRALHGLSCDSGGSASQSLSFDLRLGRDLVPTAAPALARADY